MQVRRRADEQRFRMLPFNLAGLRTDPRAVLSGGPGAAAHGAAVAVEDLDVYVRRSDIAALVERHGLLPEVDEVNVVVRVVDDKVWSFAGDRVAPLLVCALDSFERLDRRSAHEAVRCGADRPAQARRREHRGPSGLGEASVMGGCRCAGRSGTWLPPATFGEFVRVAVGVS